MSVILKKTIQHFIEKESPALLSDEISNTELCEIINLYDNAYSFDELEIGNADESKEYKPRRKRNDYARVQKKFEELVKTRFVRSGDECHFDMMMESTLFISDEFSLDSKVVAGKSCAHYAYPWNKCFLPEKPNKIDDEFVLNNFAIWHIHGCFLNLVVLR